MFKYRLRPFRNDKSDDRIEEWSEEFEKIEQRVDDTKRVFGDFHKKVASLSATDDDKKMKKSPLYPVRQEMETTQKSTSDPFLQFVMQHLVSALDTEVGRYCKYLKDVDDKVVLPSRDLENHCRHLLKTRKNLSQQYTDLNSRRQAMPQENSTGTAFVLQGANPSSQAQAFNDANNPLNKLKEQIEDLSRSCANSRDKYLKDLMDFVSTEEERAKIFLFYLELQKEYHESCMRDIEEKIADFRHAVGLRAHRTVYGVELGQHLQDTNAQISFVLKVCAEALLKPYYIREQGLFRISPSKSKGDLLIARLNVMPVEVQFLKDYDSSTITFAMKQYIGTLPGTLLGSNPNMWREAVEKTSLEERIEALRGCVKQLSKAYESNLAYLCHFLWIVTQYKEQNSMDSYNIPVVFAPNLFHMGAAMIADWQLTTVRLLIEESEQIFQKKCDELFPDWKKKLELDVPNKPPSGGTIVGHSMVPPVPSVAPPPPPPSMPPVPHEPPSFSVHDMPSSPNNAASFDLATTQQQHRRHPSVGSNNIMGAPADGPMGGAATYPLPSSSSSVTKELAVQRTNLHYSTSVASRTPPSRPPVGPTPTVRPSTTNKRAPPPPPDQAPSEAAASTTVAGSASADSTSSSAGEVNSGSPVMRSRQLGGIGAGGLHPTPAPRKTIQSAVISSSSLQAVITPKSATPSLSALNESDSAAAVAAGSSSTTPSRLLYPSLDHLESAGASSVKPARPNVPPIKSLRSAQGDSDTPAAAAASAEVQENTYL